MFLLWMELWFVKWLNMCVLRALHAWTLYCLHPHKFPHPQDRS